MSLPSDLNKLCERAAFVKRCHACAGMLWMDANGCTAHAMSISARTSDTEIIFHKSPKLHISGRAGHQAISFFFGGEKKVR